MSRQKKQLDVTGFNLPTHIAIIMDGNGRWAKQRGLPRQAGHRAGVENLRRVIDACVEFSVQILTIYAFSTENWGRPETEVRGLMRIFRRVLDQGAGSAAAHVVARRSRRSSDADIDDPGRCAVEDGRLWDHPHLLPHLPLWWL